MQYIRGTPKIWNGAYNFYKTRQTWCHVFLMKTSTCFMAFHVAQVKYMAFVHILIKHTAAALGYVSPRP